MTNIQHCDLLEGTAIERDPRKSGRGTQFLNEIHAQASAQKPEVISMRL
jgi:N-acetylglutamate synthase-like GNAT family acetyltransferase